ncbi:efflux RND transporter permease subunit [Desulfovibrio sp. JC010]|uniref:efflux RND transporter permease subunit n=1 Tax=Desulfovibrio sp. JC010 TaxID=2593641 RepID=UPI0013D33B0D|nr:efflux RND transporter permease subunit [Desulfovibrio sp. JC010]NDV27107.1 efflux RND transporter permease subunit [Desulfovibrio sp. JC010]
MPKNKQDTIFSFFFLRRVPAVIWGLVLLGFGLVGYHSMNKEALPDLEIPTFYVTTVWEGANSAMMEKSITQKIEKELRGLKAVKRVRSTSTYSTSLIIVTFEADCSIQDSQQRLRQRVDTARNELPGSAKAPKIEFSTVNDIPVTTVALSGEVSRSVLEELGRSLRRELRRIPGVRKVNKVGIRKEVVHIQLHPDKLKEYGIPASLVREKITRNGADAPWGKFENRDLNFSLRMDGVYNELEDLKNLFIGKRFGGGIVRLEDIATVSKSHMRGAQLAALSWEGGEFETVVGLEILKSPGYDTMDMVDKIRRELSKTQSSTFWPEGVHWHLTGDQSEMIQTELDRGLSNGWQAMLAVFCVLLALLTWREATVAALSVPLTLLGTVAVLWAMGYTFNLLVIIGMIIALGLLVDDFILIMEGMHDALFLKGMHFAEAVKYTISTYAVPSFSGSLTTILVFTPLAMIPGVDGKFMRVIPVTAAVCLVVSFIVSIIIGPALLRPFLGKHGSHEPGFVDKLSHKLETKLTRWLSSNVVADKKRAGLWLAGALGIFMCSIVATEGMRATLYNDEDGRTIGISVELARDTPIEETAQLAEKLSRILQNKPYIQNIMRVVSGKDAYSKSSDFDHMRGEQTPHIMGFGCYLIPGKDRERIGFDYVPELQKEFQEALKNQPGAKLYINAQRGGPENGDPIQIQVSGTDFNELRNISRRIKEELHSIPGIYDVRDNLGPARSELRYTPMREALDHHGLSTEELANQMMVYMENEKIADYQLPGTEDDLEIRIGTWWPSQNGKMAGPKSWNELAGLSIINEKGESIPLESVANPHMSTATPLILHADGRRAVTVLAKNTGIYLPEVVEKMHPVLKEMQQDWPEGYTYTIIGDEEADETYANMFKAFCGSIILVFAILALLFDSLLYPLIILSTVLFALAGVFFGFMLFGLPFSFSAAIGIVALVGIVVNDAIIVVETIRNHLKDGMPLLQAAARGAADRLRPITSTTITNFAGLTPLALSDPGWAPICQAIIFGEITATVGAIILIPALFVVLTRTTPQSHS